MAKFAKGKKQIQGLILVSLRTMLRDLAHALLYFALLMPISAIRWQLKYW